MRTHMSRIPLAIAVLLAVAGSAFSGEAIVSTMQNLPAYFDYNGYSIQPIGTTTTPGDQGPTQLFQIIRPSSAPLTIGRLYTSCTCIQLSADKKTFGADESVILTLRNVRHTSGNTYPFYVQLTSPVRATLRYDTYVVSDSNAAPQSQPVAVAETVIEETPIAAAEEEVIAPMPAVVEPEMDEPAEIPVPEKAEKKADSREEAPAVSPVEEKIAAPISESGKPGEKAALKEPAGTDDANGSKAAVQSAQPDTPRDPAEPPLREVNASAIAILEQTMKAEKKEK